MKQEHCVRCNHKWYRRSPEKPLRCPKCSNTKWDQLAIFGHNKKIEYIHWLKNQVNRCDPVGDLAYDFMCDKKARRLKSYNRFLEYLVEVHACDGAIEACKQSYKEYSEYVGLV